MADEPDLAELIDAVERTTKVDERLRRLRSRRRTNILEDGRDAVLRDSVPDADRKVDA